MVILLTVRVRIAIESRWESCLYPRPLDAALDDCAVEVFERRQRVGAVSARGLGRGQFLAHAIGLRVQDGVSGRWSSSAVVTGSCALQHPRRLRVVVRLKQRVPAKPDEKHAHDDE